MIKGWRTQMESLLLIRFVLGFFIILSMSLVVGALIYNRTSIVLGDEVKESNRLLLEQGMNVLDKRWESIDLFIRRITEDSKVARLQQTDNPFDTINLYRTIEARARLQDYYNSNELVAGYYILFKNNLLVLNNDYTARLHDFVHYLQYPHKPEGYIASLAQAYHYRDIEPVEPVTLQGTTYQLLTYLRSFGFANYSKGTVMVLINNNEITKLFNGFKTDGGWTYIADQKGNIVTSVIGPNAKLPVERLLLPDRSGVMSRTVGEDEMIVTYATSSYNGWTYVAAQPSKVVLRKITYIKETTVSVFLLFLLLGGLFGVYMAYRSSKPVRAVIQTLTASNQELHDKMQRQLPFLKAAFFERLLRGQYQSDADMEAVRAHVKVEWEGESFMVALVTFPNRAVVLNAADIEYLNQKKLIVRELIHEIGKDGLFIHDVDEDKIALILQFAGEPEQIYDSVASSLGMLQRRIQQQCGIALIISIGNLYSRRMDISRSFLEAQQALIHSADNRLVWFKDLLPNPSSYYYPESTETRMMNLVRTGNEEALKALLGELHQHNFVDRSLPVFVLKVFLFDFLASVYKISGETGEPARMYVADAMNGVADNVASIEAHYLLLKNELEAICMTVRQQRSESQRQWFQNILEYMDSQFSDGQMSLTMLAERFNVTETYLSRIFKEKTGINFFDYLENHRIEKSKQLLLLSELAVRDIALSVGYSSSNTFGRAFKRTEGISAMAFRNSSRSKEDKT